MNVVPLAWTKLARDDERRKEKKKKNDDPRGRRRRLFENEARLACSAFVFFWEGILRARALYSTRIFGETFLCGANLKSTLKNTTKSTTTTTTTTRRTKNLPLPNTRRKTRLCRRRRRLLRRRLRVFHRCSGDAHCSVLSTNRESQT